MKSIFSIFKRGLEKTTTKVARTIGSIFTGVKAHSAESFDELEELLIAADFGVPASLRIVGEIRDRYERGAIATNADLARIASETVKDILRQRARAIHTGEPGKPTVILMVTAGRQHNQKGLMDELAKIRRSIEKVYPGAPHEVWLTVDASLGGNVLNQAREFSKTTGVTGLVLTKLDGTGKGGMVVALHQEFELPTFFIGLGEQPEDLQPFSPEYYADALFGEEAPREE